jgi:hypothetical protein
VLALLTATGADASDRTVVGSGAMEQDSWSGPTGGLPIRVVNPFGDIRLRHGEADQQLEVAAVLQQLAVDGARLSLDVDVSGDAVEVSIIRYDYQGNPVTEVPRGDLARADLAVMVPDGGTVQAETTAGLLECRGVRADLDLRTDRGTIQAAGNRGAITAHSNSGAMEITLEPGATRAAQTLTSDTGEIVVLTPPSNDIDVTMTTSGSFTTDFSLEVEHRDGTEPDKIATATIGEGGAALNMSSRRGDLTLHRVTPADPR